MTSDECEDGNEVSGDGCSKDCQIEYGYICSGNPSSCFTQCGDGILAGTEECEPELSEYCTSECKINKESEEY